MVARLASIASGTKRLQVRVLRWSFFVILTDQDLLAVSPLTATLSLKKYSVERYHPNLCGSLRTSSIS